MVTGVAGVLSVLLQLLLKLADWSGHRSLQARGVLCTDDERQFTAASSCGWHTHRSWKMMHGMPEDRALLLTASAHCECRVGGLAAELSSGSIRCTA